MRSNVYIKVVVEHGPDEKPEDLGAELCRQLQKIGERALIERHLGHLLAGNQGGDGRILGLDLGCLGLNLDGLLDVS